MSIYVVEELCFMCGDLIGSSILTRAFTNWNKAYELMKTLTPADGIISDEIDQTRGVRVITYDTEEVIEYHIQELEVEL